jgi:hypothetical protein
MLCAHETKEMPDVAGVFLLICPALEKDTTILQDFEMVSCRQIVTGIYPRVLHELAVKVVPTLDGGLQSAMVEWGDHPTDKKRVGLLVGPLPSDYDKEKVKSWNIPQAWLHVHIKYL